MNKKGSMELSVNSIVILVIAIVIMGLILGFIKSKFAEVGGNLITNEPDAGGANQQDTLTLSRETISTVPGGQSVVKSNAFAMNGVSSANLNVSCSGTPVTFIGANQNQLNVKSGVKNINSNDQAPFIVTLSVGKSVPRGSYLCSMYVEGYFTVATIAPAVAACPASAPTCGTTCPADMQPASQQLARCRGKITEINAKDFVLQIN